MSSISLRATNLFSVEGKVVVITGGGRGIGKMMAKGFVVNGARVYIASRSEKACFDTAAELTNIGPGLCIGIKADLSTEEGCIGLAEEIATRENEVNVLINNSGATWGDAFEDHPDKAWNKLYALNVKGVFYMTRALISLLDKGSRPDDPGRIINIGSIAGVLPQLVPTYAYDASKAAVHHLSKKLASDFVDRSDKGGHRITVNVIAPGLFPSRMGDQLIALAGEDGIRETIPLGRAGGEADAAGVALFLSSPAGAWITGVVLQVDGGALIKLVGEAPTPKL